MASSVQNLVILLSVLCSLQVAAYPNGQVTQSCSSMEPNHQATAQTSSAPYTLTVSKTNNTNVDKFTVTLSKMSGAPDFKGFLIQARAGSSNTPLGSFEISGTELQTLTCTTAASAVSHRSSSPKSSVQMTWIAPNATLSEIQLRATVVQTRVIYWTNVASSKVFQVNSGGCHLWVPALGQVLLSSTLVIYALLNL